MGETWIGSREMGPHEWDEMKVYRRHVGVWNRTVWLEEEAAWRLKDAMVCEIRARTAETDPRGWRWDWRTAWETHMTEQPGEAAYQLLDDPLNRACTYSMQFFHCMRLTITLVLYLPLINWEIGMIKITLSETVTLIG